MIQKFAKRYAPKSLNLVQAMRYEPTLEGRAAIKEFAGDRIVVPATDNPQIRRGELSWFEVQPGDWVVERHQGYFEATPDVDFAEMFYPVNEAPHDNIDDHQVEALAFALKGMTEPGNMIPTRLQERVTKKMRDIFDETARVVGMDLAEKEDKTAFVSGLKGPAPVTVSEGDNLFVIRGEHPHSKLIQSIIAMTGISEMVEYEPRARPILADNQPYEVALVAMKAGYRVTREGWNCKGMWLCIGEGQKIYPEDFWNPHTKRFAQQRYDDGRAHDQRDDRRRTEVLPYIIMKTADDKILMGWLASQSDQFANDWIILED